MIDDNDFGVYIDVKKTIELNRDLVKVQMGEANGPCITLDLLAFYPAEDTQPPMPPPLQGVAMGMPPNMAYPTPPFFGPGQFPHMMLSHPISGHAMPGQPHRLMAPPTTQVNPAQLHGSAHHHGSLPPPPMTTAYPGAWSGDTPGGEKKKRKRSVELRPDESKRRKSEFSTPTHTPVTSNGMIPGTPVDDLDVIDLTFEDAMP